MRRISSITIACCLICIFCLAAVGCKYSSYTTEKVYDADSSQADEQNIVHINSIDANKTSTDLPQIDYDGSSEERSKALTAPSSGKGESDVLVPKIEYDSDAEKGQPASVATKSTDEQSSQQANENSNGEDESKTKSKEGSSAKGSKGSKNGSHKKGSGNNGDKSGKWGGANRSKSEKKVYSDYGDLPEIPQGVKHVAVVGNNASTVAAISDKGTILAASKEFLGDGNVQKVLGSKLKKAKTLWNKNGKLTDVDALIKLDIQLVYVDEDSSNLTKKQVNELLDAGIIVYELPDMNTVAEIETSVDIIGKTLKKGGSKKAGKRAQALVDYYQKTIETLIEKSGGMVAGGYDFETGEDVESTLPELYTLYISDWDKTARYKDLNGYVESEYGVAISNLGSSWSPLSYLLSTAGVIDNAAKGRYSYLDGHKAFVWQFNQNKVSANYSNWLRFDKKKQDYRIMATDGFTESLLWSEKGNCGLGSEKFPRVLVRTQEIRNLMLKDAQNDNGIYHPYPQISSSSGTKVSVIGFYANGVLCDACIGTSGKAFESVLNDGEHVEYYEVTVNPTGLFNSWTDGSIESVLEAEWAYSLFYDDSYDIEDRVEDFYQDFYEYSLSQDELETILAGPSK